MRLSKGSWDALLVASIVVVSGLCAQFPQIVRAEDDTPPEGKIVRIAPDSQDEATEEETEESPIYWIGISGRGVESSVLRTQLQLAQDMGIVVEQVVADSPADKAGLRKHDIILRVNGAAVHGMVVLQDYVRTHQAKPLELKLLRLGKEETVVVVPEERSQAFNDFKINPSQGLRNGLGAPSDALVRLMEQLQREGGLPRGMRMFDPGEFFPGQQQRLAELPSGVSVSIQQEGDGPAKITVKQGDKTWHVVGGDPKSLEQLPENLRPFVGRMLQRQEGTPDWGAELEPLLPQGLGGGLGGRFAPQRKPEFQEKEFLERMAKMEQELRELRERFSKQESDLSKPQ